MKLAAIVIGMACAGLVGALASGSLTDPAPPMSLDSADASRLQSRVLSPFLCHLLKALLRFYRLSIWEMILLTSILVTVWLRNYYTS